MSLNLQVNILGDYDKLTKATKGAKKELTGFEKASKRMSQAAAKNFRRVAGALAVAGISRFLVASAKAAGEDQRAQKILATTMERVAGAKAKDIKATEDLIGGMEMASGVADDFLRPAMSKLVSTTKNVNKAQTLLKVALGASAKSGKPLQKVTDAISKAYLGNKKALEKMFPELVGSKNALKDLAAVSKGMAAQNADPFQKLQRGLDNIKETIGGPLVSKLNDFMDSLFSKKNAGSMSDANEAIGGMASSIGLFFGAISGDGNAAKGVLDTIKTLADSISIAFETAAFYLTLIQGKKITQGMFPTMEGLGRSFEKSGFFQSKASNPNQLFNVKGKVPVGGNSGPNITYTNTYNVNAKTTPTTHMTAQEIIKAIQRYEKTTGKKYLGPTR